MIKLMGTGEKMKILWLCNIVVPQILKKLGDAGTSMGGSWLVETLEKLSNDDSVEIAYCAPYKSNKNITRVKYRNTIFYGFNKKKWSSHIYDKTLESTFKKILGKFHPDIVHIFGTEFPHALAMVKSFNCPSRTVIHIQGLAFYWGGVIEPIYQQKFIMA